MGEKPSHRALMAESYESGDSTKSKFTDIGAAWPVKDGKGFKVKLSAFPISGEILLLPNEPKAS
jgi:hypothetical protein